jgi:hypothetical protein
VTRAGRLRALLPWAVLAAAVAVIAAATAAPGDDGPALDPTSTGPPGTKGLVDTLRELGVAVEVSDGAPAPQATTALVLVDAFGDAERAAVERWARAGGRLVVADPDSPLNPARSVADRGFAFPSVDADLRRDCALPALRDVQVVRAPAPVRMQVPPDAAACFLDGDGAWLVATPLGRGTVVSLGGPLALTNAVLDEADNAVLAVSLLAPTAGDRVAILRPPPPGGGRETLGDLVSPRVWLALVQLGVAFLVLAAWRARRLGRPVLEPQPVQVAGSELVVAVGELLQRARAREQAAALLRDDLRREVARRLGLPAGLPPEAVARAVAARTGLPPAEVAGALAGGPPGDEDALVRLARQVEAVREEVTHAGRA